MFFKQTIPKTFVQQCRKKESLPADMRHTIDVLLKEVGTKNCNLAFIELNNLTYLNI